MTKNIFFFKIPMNDVDFTEKNYILGIRKINGFDPLESKRILHNLVNRAFITIHSP